MTDNHEMLEMAAKAAGFKECGWMGGTFTHVVNNQFVFWDPLNDDGDALRLAVKLWLNVSQSGGRTMVHKAGIAPGCEDWTAAQNSAAATRRAIVRAAAEIGRQMK